MKFFVVCYFMKFCKNLSFYLIMQEQDEKGYVILTNNILSQLHVPKKIKRLKDVDASVFITLYEGLCGEQLKDVIHNPRSKEDEIHNCQCVIDALSLDVLHTSLSHVNGEDIVLGDETAIANLLEVFSGLLEFILARIDSDESDTDDVNCTEDDPDVISSDTLDSALERELGASYKNKGRKSPPRTSTFDEEQTGNSTRELIRESEEVERQLKQKSHFLRSCKSASQSTATRAEADSSQPVLSTAPQVGYSLSRRYVAADSHLSPSKPRSVLKRADTTFDVSSTSSRAGTKEEMPMDGPASSSQIIMDPITAVQNANYRIAERDITPAIPLTIHQGDSLLERRTYAVYPDHKEAVEQIGAVAATVPAVLPAGSDRAPSPTHSHVSLDSMPTMKENNEFNMLGVRPRHASTELSSSQKTDQPAHHTFTHHLYHHYERSDKPAQTNVPDFSTVCDTKTRYASEPATAYKRTIPSVTKAYSYDNLEKLVKTTADIAQQAVDHSPLKGTRLTDHQPLQEKKSRRYNTSDDVVTRLRVLQEESEKLKKLTRSFTGLPSHRLSGTQDSSKLSQSLRPRYSTCDKKPVKRRVKFANPKESQELTLSDMEETVRCKGTKRPTASSSSNRNNSAYTGPAREYIQPRRTADYYEKYLKDYKKEAEYSDDELSTRSDGIIDYGHSSISETESEDDAYLRSPPRKTQKNRVHFHDRVTDVFDRLASEDKLTKIKNRFLSKKLQQDYKELADENVYDFHKTRVKADQENKAFWEKVCKKTNEPKRKSGRTSASRKSVLLPRRGIKRTPQSKRKRSASSSPCFEREQLYIHDDDDILPYTLGEFPFVHLSKETTKQLWTHGNKQLEQLTRAAKEVQRKKSKAQVELEEADRRQEILMNIMKKELSHNKRLRELKDQKAHQLSVKGKLRDKKLQSARSRRYYDEFQIKHRSKMLQRRTREEMIFKKLFKEALDIQKERVRDLRTYAKEQREKQVNKQQNEIASLENYYRDQFATLAESISRERTDLKIQNNAQNKVLTQMKRELRRKMEKEIHALQEQMQRDEDEAHFRQLDADRVRQKLHMARYATQHI